MRKRLWMTLLAFATPSACLLLGVLSTIGAVRAVSEITETAHRHSLEDALVVASATFARRIEGATAPSLADRATAALDGLNAGADTGIGVRHHGHLIAHNAGQAQLVE